MLQILLLFIKVIELIKLESVGHIKNEWNLVTKPKEKSKKTSWELSSYRHHNLSTVEL